MLCLSDFRKYRQHIYKFLEKKFYTVDLRNKSVCAVVMTVRVHWTCINVNRIDVHASMISFN